MSPFILELRDVTRRFPGIVALDRVSLGLSRGEIHALVGENGAGKSTLINILCGALAPDEGSLLLEGEPVRFTGPVGARRSGVVAVHQEADLFGTLSLAENLALIGGLPVGPFGLIRWGEVRRRAEQAIAALGEPIDVTLPAGQLGLAPRHLAQLADAIARKPRVLILDEPTSSLTAAESEWLFRQLDALKCAGVAILYISHRQEEIFRLADRVTVLRDGMRVWNGPISEVDSPGLVRLMVGRETPQRAPRTKQNLTGVVAFQCEGFTDAAGRFSDICLSVRTGEIVGVYGLVGAGRSEWAQAVFGLSPASSGSIDIDGQRTTIRSPGDAIAAGLALLPEDRLRQGVFRGLSVRANSVVASLRAFARGPFSRPSLERRAANEEAKALGVRLRSIEQPIGELSGGNQQKVVFGRWRLTRPRVFLLDEPTRGVDVSAKAEIHGFIRELANGGAAIVMISSELPEILAHSDRIVVFRSGRIAREFTPEAATAEAVAHAALPTGDAVSAKPIRDTLRRPSARLFFSEAGLLAAVAMMAGALALTRPAFSSAENLSGVANHAATWVILGLGAATVIVAGGIDISIGALLALSAGAAGLTMTRSELGALAIPLGVAVGLVTGAVGGALNASLALVGRVHPIVVTLATMTIFRGVLILITGGDVVTGLPPGFGQLATTRVAGLQGAVWLALLCVVLTGGWLNQWTSGRELYAVGSSERAAWLAGIRKGAVWMRAFTGGGLAAGLAGLVELAMTGSMQSRLGVGYELRAIAAAVIGGVAITGGRGGPIGVLLGGLLLSLIENALVLWSVSPARYDLVVGGLLTGAVLLDRWARRGEP